MRFQMATVLRAIVTHNPGCARKLPMKPVVGAKCRRCGAAVVSVVTEPDYSGIQPLPVAREPNGRSQRPRHGHTLGALVMIGRGRKKRLVAP